MIVKQEFETIHSLLGTKNLENFSLIEETEKLKGRWKDYIVDNSKVVNFRLDDDNNLIYKTINGEIRKSHISEFAFGQLCTRLGVPASYIVKCFETGKSDLAISNFSVWASSMNKALLFREFDGVIRSVLSSDYVTFDSYKIANAIERVIDKNVYVPSQVHLSADRMHVRYVNYNSLDVPESSKLYSGFTLDSSDVGRGSLNMKFFLYRFVCQNGLVQAKKGGVIYRQSHSGEAMAAGKIEEFHKAIEKVDTLSENAVQLIKGSQNTILKPYEVELLLERAKRELKLSQKSSDELLKLSSSYGNTKWGVINGITELAQNFTLDTRLDYETYAGALLVNG